MPSMIDTRFAAPPEDFELLKEPSSSAKGKGRLEERVKPTAVRKAKKQQQERWQPAHDNDSASNSEHDLYDEILNGPIPSTSYGTGSHNEDADDIGPGNDEDADEMRDNEDEPLNLIPKVLQLDNVEDFNKKVDRTGLIYLSRIPPGMGPSKVKHILSNYGEIGRIYLVAALDEKRKTSSSSSSHGSSKKNDHKHRPHRFVEGWVEFMDKRVARSTAELLNARPIGDIAMSKGSKKNGGTRKWQDDVWTMKYLPRFKWNMLSEQVAIEAATRAALLRNELAQSKKEQAEYLRQVERAKNYEKSQEKKRARDERKGDAIVKEGDKPSKKVKKERHFEQKTVVTPKGQGVIDAKLGSVLDSLF